MVGGWKMKDGCEFVVLTGLRKIQISTTRKTLLARASAKRRSIVWVLSPERCFHNGQHLVLTFELFRVGTRALWPIFNLMQFF